LSSVRGARSSFLKKCTFNFILILALGLVP
jgi:hypothetical protein